MRRRCKSSADNLRLPATPASTLRQRMKTPRVIALVVLAIVLAFAAVTLVALEGSEVAVLHTALSNREPRDTRVWVADFAGTPWIEAASPERDFYRDIVNDPNVELSRGGERFAYHAVPVSAASGHDLIRSMLRDKYGWADRWIGLLADTSGSIAVRLESR